MYFLNKKLENNLCFKTHYTTQQIPLGIFITIYYFLGFLFNSYVASVAAPGANFFYLFFLTDGDGRTDGRTDDDGRTDGF